MKKKMNIAFKKGRFFTVFLFLILISLVTIYLATSDARKVYEAEKTFAKLKKEKSNGNYPTYKNMIGWIEIPNTDFSYPVMQTKSEPEYYLHRDVYGNYSFYGTPFLDPRCDVKTSDNLIIYGHNINGRRFFGYLQNYRDSSFYGLHKTIIFSYSIPYFKDYEVVSVILTDTSSFLYNFVEVGNIDKYYDYVKKIIDKSIYPTDAQKKIRIEMKSDREAFFKTRRFITLSTCRTGEGKDKRLLVIASKKI